MENEYKIILNMQDEMFNILKKSIEDDGYNIILRDEKVMFIEKSKENLTDDGTLVQLTAWLSYGEEKASHSFYAMIFPPKMNRIEKTMEQLKRELDNANRETVTEEYMILPDQVDGQEIIWSFEESTRAFGILVLGGGAACMLCI